MLQVASVSRRTVVSILAALLLSAGLVGGTLAVASPAHAIPGGCTSSMHKVAGGWGKSFCDRGSGEHRVRLECFNNNVANRTVVVYGPWMSPRNTSTVYCASSRTPIKVSYQTRG